MNMNKRILVLCDRIPPEQSATGRFIFKISEELSKKHPVYLVCLQSKKIFLNNSVKVYAALDRYGIYKEKVRKTSCLRGVSKLISKIDYHIYYFFACKFGLSEIKENSRSFIKKCSFRRNCLI